MQHMDIWAVNVMVAAHQENVARALRDSQRRSTLAIRLGSLLIWLGERLARDSVNRAPVRDAAPTRRPQVA